MNFSLGEIMNRINIPNESFARKVSSEIDVGPLEEPQRFLASRNGNLSAKGTHNSGHYQRRYMTSLIDQILNKSKMDHGNPVTGSGLIQPTGTVYQTLNSMIVISKLFSIVNSAFLINNNSFLG